MDSREIRRYPIEITGIGGSMDDIVRVRIYVRDTERSEENIQHIHEARLEYFNSDHYPASTLIGVSDFVQPEYLIEIDAEAIILVQ